MSPTDISELLRRAAGSVTPVETDPARKLADLGRRSVRRRHFTWGFAAPVAAAATVAAVVVLPLGDTSGTDEFATPGTTVTAGGLTVEVPEGWRTKQVGVLDLCEAESRTVYLAERYTVDGTRPSDPPRNYRERPCPSKGQEWIGVAVTGVAPLVNPSRLLVKDAQLVQVEEAFEPRIVDAIAYRAFNEVIQAPTVFVSGDQKLLDRVTWPAGPQPPAGGGLALPDRITSATTELGPPTNGMIVASDAPTLNKILSKLAALHDDVPGDEECALRKPGSLGINLGEITVVLGDATCPQAISTAGGRVRVPAGLGEELRQLIADSPGN